MRNMEERKEDLQEAEVSEDTQEACASEEETATETSAGEDVQAEENTGDTVSEDAGDTDVSDEAQEDAKADKKIFKKKQKADKKQDAMKEKIDELEDKVKRQMAEFDNFRKRTEKEKAAMFETGAKSVEKIRPVIDNCERGFAAVATDAKTPFEEGMEMVYKQLMAELEKMEVKPIPAVGEEFDPNFHNAVMQVESEEYEPGVVAQELMKGYTYRDSVVRHSMVAVVSE